MFEPLHPGEHSQNASSWLKQSCKKKLSSKVCFSESHTRCGKLKSLTPERLSLWLTRTSKKVAQQPPELPFIWQRGDCFSKESEGVHAQSCPTVDLYPASLLSREFPRQEYWSRLPFPPPGDLPNPGINPTSLLSHSLAGRFFTTVPPEMP